MNAMFVVCVPLLVLLTSAGSLAWLRSRLSGYKGQGGGGALWLQRRAGTRAVCRRLDAQAAGPATWTWATPSRIEFNETGVSETSCYWNHELGRSNQLLPVMHVHDAFGRWVTGVWMYYAEGCSDLMWDAGRTLAAPNKISAAIHLLLEESPCGPSDVVCAKRELLARIHKKEAGKGNATMGASPCGDPRRPLCGIRNFCAIVEAYPYRLAACPTSKWAHVAAAVGCPFDDVIYPLLRSHGYDSLQLLASPQGRNPRRWRTEIWDIRDTRAQDQIERQAHRGSGKFFSALRCEGAPCRPTAEFPDCLSCQGCHSACDGHVHQGPLPAERDHCLNVLSSTANMPWALSSGPIRQALPHPPHPHALPAFNLGMIKTGTTSLDRAMQLMGLNPCKWQPQPNNFSLADMAAFARSPHRGATPLHHLVRDGVCGGLSDNPWWMLYPSLLAGYPEAKFILTVRPGPKRERCARWLRSAKLTWKDNEAKPGGFAPGYVRPNHRPPA